MRWPDGRLSDSQRDLAAQHWPYALRTVARRFRNLYGDSFDWDGAVAIGVMRAAKAWQPDREDGKRLNFKTFMYRSAVTECRNMLRQSLPLGYRRPGRGPHPEIASIERSGLGSGDAKVTYDELISDDAPPVDADGDRIADVLPLLFLGSLTRLERDVIIRRYYYADGERFEDIGRACGGFSKCYMVQVHHRAMRKLRESLGIGVGVGMAVGVS